MEIQLEQWANGILKDTRKQWESLKEQSDTLKDGFAVFYSSPRINPDLMVIGYNPGGNKENSRFDPERESSISNIAGHEYFQNDYKLAKKMKEVFADIGEIEILRNSVKLNLIFFRTKREAKWKSIEKTLRQEMEDFCFEKVKDIIEHLQPKLIITEGIDTFNTLTRQVLQSPEKPTYDGDPKKSNMTIFAKGTYMNIPIIGLIHPSGARYSTEAFERIKSLLKTELKNMK